MPLVIAGVTAALLMMIATRVTNPWTALLAWIVWQTTPLVLRFQPSYFSETTSARAWTGANHTGNAPA